MRASPRKPQLAITAAAAETPERYSTVLELRANKRAADAEARSVALEAENELLRGKVATVRARRRLDFDGPQANSSKQEASRAAPRYAPENDMQ